jgi:hypothetical protein
VLAIRFARWFGLSERWTLFLYLWHLLFGLFLYRAPSGGGFDAANYYLSSIGQLKLLKIGTQTVIHITALFSKSFNLSYLAVTIIFNFFGFTSLLIWSSIFYSNTSEKTRTTRILAMMFFLLPGIRFWNAGIGKDVLTFLGIAIVSFARYRAEHIWGLISLGIGLAFLVRPHIAAFLLLGIIVYFMVNSRLNVTYRLLLLSVTVVVAFATLPFLAAYLGFEENVGIGGVSVYVENRQNYNLEGNFSIDISSISVPQRLFSYLFRPFPLEAPGLMGLAAGLENMFLLLLFIVLLPRIVMGRNSGGRDFLMFALFFCLLCLLVLANITANLGIVFRQKWKFLPLLFAFAISTAESRLVSMDIGVMPLPDTPWARGKCSYKLIQYMACGLPVVTPPVGMNKEIVEHCVNGFLAESGEEWRKAIEALISNPDLRRRMGAAGHKKVEDSYSLQVWGPRVAQMLRQVADEGQKA